MLGGNPFLARDVISILDFSRADLELLFSEADKARGLVGRRLDLLRDKVVALAFFEPSTRTRLSFETAAKRLGAETIGFSSEEGTSLMKGENLADTIRMLDSYADLIVIRHSSDGAAKYAAEIASKPVINAGDGKQHHPTQAMLDLYTVRDLFGRVDGLVYGAMGDIKHGRAIASFVLGLSLFSPKKVYLIAPRELRARPELKMELDARGVRYEEVDRPEEVISELDVLYVTRIQKERFADPSEYERVKGSYVLTPKLLEAAKESLRILHPLPKVDEVDPKVDESRHAAYFHQASLGVPVRMALLALEFGVRL